MAHFKIIKNSEGAKWNIEDREFYGIQNGLLCGWEYELQKCDGSTGFATVHFSDTMPDIIEEWLLWSWEERGLKPTGRVVFRGYYEEYYSIEHHDECVREVIVEKPKTEKCVTCLADLLNSICV